MKTCTPKRKINDLQVLILPYAELWEEWTGSAACPFSEKELIIINNYLLAGSHHVSCLNLNIPSSSASSILKKAKKRLKWFYPRFQMWVTERLLEKSGIVIYSSDLDRFLNSPIEYLPINNLLKRKLLMIPVKTMTELLSQYTIAEIRKFRGFGNKKIEELKLLLKNNNCLDFLR